MISVLIPVYNADVVQLVQAISKQLGSITAEIILLDDGSHPSYRNANRAFTNDQIFYYQSDTNRGRFAARRMLAEKAKYPWLLFLDSDSAIIRDDFILQYSNLTTGVADVVVGGRVYATTAPENKELMLHWRYGSERERINFSQKSDFPYGGFMSNNFLVRKEIFLQLEELPGLKGYGHEDTWMGMQFEKLGCRISFIDNPVLHEGLETADAFLQKTKNALQNLLQLQKQAGNATLSRHVRIFRYYLKMKLRGGLPLLNLMHLLAGKAMLRNLRSGKPSLFVFDLYRLHLLSIIDKGGSA